MAQSESRNIKIGSPALNFILPATNGKNYSLGSFKKSVGLVIVFTCNHCPYAKAAWPLLVALANEFKKQGISFVAINPNDEKQFPEDSLEVMKQKVAQWNINFPYLRDKDQIAAKQYGAVCTPDIYLYNGNRKLYYHGRINSTWPPVKKIENHWQINKPDKNSREELKKAIKSLITGSPPPKVQNPSMGCSIKWTQ